MSFVGKAGTSKGVAVIANYRHFGKAVYPMSVPATTSTTTLTAEIEYVGETNTVNAVTVRAGDYEPPKMIPLYELEEWLPREDFFYTGPSKDQVSKGRHSSRMPLMRSEWNRHPRIKRSSAKG